MNACISMEYSNFSWKVCFFNKSFSSCICRGCLETSRAPELTKVITFQSMRMSHGSCLFLQLNNLTGNPTPHFSLYSGYMPNYLPSQAFYSKGYAICFLKTKYMSHNNSCNLLCQCYAQKMPSL